MVPYDDFFCLVFYYLVDSNVEHGSFFQQANI
jgi:hypothetical protein